MKYHKRPKELIRENLEDIRDPNLAQKYVNIQKEINSKFEQINNINSEIAELKSQLQEIEEQSQENREEREETSEEFNEVQESFQTISEQDDREIILPIEKYEIPSDEDYLSPEEIEDIYDYNEYEESEEGEEEAAEDEEPEEPEEGEETGEYLFYVEIFPHEENDKNYAKIYKTREGSNWEITVGNENDEILEDMTFEEDYSKIDIISYLASFYNDVNEISESKYLENINIEE